MIIAPPLYPASETPKAIQVEAGGLIKMVLDVDHKVHRPSLFEGQGFILILEEVIKELLLDPHRFCLLKGGNVEFVVDPEDMLQVFPPTTAVKFRCQPHGIVEGRPWPTSLLRLGSFRCWWWWNTGRQPRGQIALLTWWLCTHLLLHASGVTDGSTAASPPSHVRSSMVLCTCTAHGDGFICGGVRNDSSPRRLLWWLYRLLIRCGQPPWWWLMERQCCLGHAWHRHGWCWHPLGQTAWTLRHLCPHDPLSRAPQPDGPPNPR